MLSFQIGTLCSIKESKYYNCHCKECYQQICYHWTVLNRYHMSFMNLESISFYELVTSWCHVGLLQIIQYYPVIIPLFSCCRGNLSRLVVITSLTFTTMYITYILLTTCNVPGQYSQNKDIIESWCILTNGGGGDLMSVVCVCVSCESLAQEYTKYSVKEVQLLKA